METTTRILNSIVVCMALESACSQEQFLRTSDSHVAGDTSANDHRMLAGEWEYEDDTIVYTVILDDHGNGEYPWNNGRFITTRLSDHLWSGEWSQEKNDRHGGFEITLSPDFSEGEGRWWYTRIERDSAPQRPGGAFRLTRIAPYPSERIR